MNILMNKELLNSLEFSFSPPEDSEGGGGGGSTDLGHFLAQQRDALQNPGDDDNKAGVDADFRNFQVPRNLISDHIDLSGVAMATPQTLLATNGSFHSDDNAQDGAMFDLDMEPSSSRNLQTHSSSSSGDEEMGSRKSSREEMLAAAMEMDEDGHHHHQPNGRLASMLSHR